MLAEKSAIAAMLYEKNRQLVPQCAKVSTL